MLKRVTWFTVGTVVGATGTVVGYLRARELARRHVPENVRDAATRAVGIADSGVRVAIDRGFVLVDGPTPRPRSRLASRLNICCASNLSAPVSEEALIPHENYSSA